MVVCAARMLLKSTRARSSLVLPHYQNTSPFFNMNVPIIGMVFPNFSFKFTEVKIKELENVNMTLSVIEIRSLKLMRRSTREVNKVKKKILILA